MKWGVRRYQKKDGSLTRLGKKRIDEGAKLFPTYKGKRIGPNSELSKNRDKAIKDIETEMTKDLKQKYDAYKKKNTNFGKNANSESDRISKWDYTIRDKNEKEATRQKFTEKFIDKYADATLNDLGISITPATKKYIQDLIRDREVSNAIVGRKDTGAKAKYTSEKQINAAFKRKYDDAVKKKMPDEDIELIELEWMEELDNFYA